MQYLNKKQASAYLANELGLRVSDKTLSKYITTGQGPKYFKFGWRVVYTIDNLNDWVNSKLSKPLPNPGFINFLQKLCSTWNYCINIIP